MILKHQKDFGPHKGIKNLSSWSSLTEADSAGISLAMPSQDSEANIYAKDTVITLILISNKLHGPGKKIKFSRNVTSDSVTAGNTLPGISLGGLQTKLKIESERKNFVICSKLLLRLQSTSPRATCLKTSSSLQFSSSKSELS